MGWGRPRVLYIPGLNEAAAQGSLGAPLLAMRKVFGSPGFWFCGGAWGGRVASREPLRSTAWPGRPGPWRSPKRLEPGRASEEHPARTERGGGG